MLITLNWVVICAVEVVEHDTRVRDLDVGLREHVSITPEDEYFRLVVTYTNVVVEVVPNRKVDPLVRRNHRGSIDSRVLNNL